MRDRERAERIQMAGAPNPNPMEWAVALAQERGAVRTRDLADIGAHIRNANEGLLIKVMESTAP